MDKINIIKATPNFPFLEATIDGLSYYQLLAGLNAYINTVVDLINTTGIEDWKDTVDKISAQVSVLATSVSRNTESINKINSQIGNDELKTDEKTLIGAINELFATIASIESAIGNENLTTSADTLIGAINELVTDISGLDESSDEFKTDIANLKNSVTQNTNDITQLKTTVQTNTDNIATANTDISRLKTDVQQNTTDIGTANTDISQLKTDVQKNTTDIGTANTDITKLKTDNTLLDGRVTSVEESEENNSNDISALKTKVGSSALATTSQNLSDAVNELKSAIGTGGEGEKTPVTSETTITVSGTTAVDAVQLNPNGVDGNGNDGLGHKTFAKKLEENSGVIENYDSRLTDVETSNSTNAAAITKANEDIKTLSDSNTQLSSDVSALSAQTENNRQNITRLQSRTDSMYTNISNNTESINTANDKITALETTTAGLTTDVDTAKSNISALQEDTEMFTSDITTITDSIGKLTELTTTAKDTLVAAINEVNAKPSGGGGETTPISNATDITATGTYALDAVQNNENVDNSLRKLIKDLTTLVGSLSDLATSIAGSSIVETINNVNGSIPILTNVATLNTKYGLVASLLSTDGSYKMSDGGLDGSSFISGNEAPTIANYGQPNHLTIGQYAKLAKDYATIAYSMLKGNTSDIDGTNAEDNIDIYGFGNLAFLVLRNVSRANLHNGLNISTFLAQYALSSDGIYPGFAWDNLTGASAPLILQGWDYVLKSVGTIGGTAACGGFVILKVENAIYNN